MANKDKNQARKQLQKGRVVQAVLPQTVTVLIERSKEHPLYHKSIKRSKRYLVHDTKGAKLGALVEIAKVRPISKNKHFEVVRILGQDIEAVVSEQLKEEAKEAIAEVMPEEREKGQESSIKGKEGDQEAEENKSRNLKKGGSAGLSGSETVKEKKVKSRKSK